MEQVKTPWYSSYDGVRQHLEYPDYSIYQFLEEASKKRESSFRISFACGRVHLFLDGL